MSTQREQHWSTDCSNANEDRSLLENHQEEEQQQHHAERDQEDERQQSSISSTADGKHLTVICRVTMKIIRRSLTLTLTLSQSIIK